MEILFHSMAEFLLPPLESRLCRRTDTNPQSIELLVVTLGGVVWLGGGYPVRHAVPASS